MTGSVVGDLLWAAIWYGCLALWLWMIIASLRTGDAGASGVPLSRKDNPIRFWGRIVWQGVWWMILATLPMLVLMRNMTPGS